MPFCWVSSSLAMGELARGRSARQCYQCVTLRLEMTVVGAEARIDSVCRSIKADFLAEFRSS